MENRLLRNLIYFFTGVIVLFTLLMVINFIGGLSGLNGEAPGPDAKAAGAMGASGVGAVKYGPGTRNSLIPAGGTNFSTVTVDSGGVGLLVKDNNFSGVAEEPKGMMDLLNDLGGAKKKPVLSLKESDLDKKIAVPSTPMKGAGHAASVMPELGREPNQEGITLLGAPVDFKLFKSSVTWRAFASSRKLANAAPDFSVSDLLILVSVSDFPSGIFKITGVETGRKETLVKYRVDPLGMSPDTPKEQREAYASAPVPKKIPVKLRQVP